VADAFEVRKFSKIRNPREIYGHGSRGSWRLGVAGCRQKKKRKNPCLTDHRANKSA